MEEAVSDQRDILNLKDERQVAFLRKYWIKTLNKKMGTSS
jgi:hypothetical protein